MSSKTTLVTTQSLCAQGELPLSEKWQNNANYDKLDRERVTKELLYSGKFSQGVILRQRCALVLRKYFAGLIFAVRV